MFIIPKGLKLPHYWLQFGKIPYSKQYEKDFPDSVYMICLFPSKRALLLRRDYKIISSTETRRARRLIDEAYSYNWISEKFKGCTLGSRPKDYPRESSEAFWVENNYLIT